MTSMVELVARAINKELTGSEENVNDFRRRLARAAIEAMREPTEAMIDAGENTGINLWIQFEAVIAWQAMIDAALAESKEG